MSDGLGLGGTYIPLEHESDIERARRRAPLPTGPIEPVEFYDAGEVPAAEIARGLEIGAIVAIIWALGIGLGWMIARAIR
jgi:hypothetical protein